jgi:hypothetical protein
VRRTLVQLRFHLVQQLLAQLVHLQRQRPHVIVTHCTRLLAVSNLD